MIKFESQYDGKGPRVLFEIPDDSTLGEMVVAFEAFLKASGYEFNGQLDIVDEPTELNDDPVELN